LLSIDDLFTAGAGLDIAGAILLGRGLLAAPTTMVGRAGSPFGGANYKALASEVEDRVDAVAGVAAIGAGFLAQATGYMLVIGLGLSAGIGWARAIVAFVFAVGAGAAVFVVDAATRWHRLRAQVIELAHHEWNGTRREQPSATMLLMLGQEFGRYPLEREILPGGDVGYARRVFGVDRLREATAEEIFSSRL
jgi:hypothetical protein